MHKKKPFCLGFVVLLLSMATVIMPVGGGVEPSPNALYVWPDSYTNFPELDTLKKGDTFTVDVMVKLEDGIKMAAWFYILKWDSTKIELTSHTINLPEALWLILLDEVGHYPDCRDYHNACVGAMGAGVPCVTPRSIATYNFTVIETMYDPPGFDFLGLLDLQDMDIDGWYGLADDYGDHIVHTVGDGHYRICAIPSPNALYVWPDSYTNFSELDTLREGDTFTVDVMVKLEDGVLLGSWFYILKWDSTNIELTNYTINLPGLWLYLVDEVGTDYHNASACMMIEGVPCVTPRSIATYNFTVIETIYEPEPDEIGTLDLQDWIWAPHLVGLGDEYGYTIPHTVDDGQYRKCAIPLIPGDINGDGIVDMLDIGIACLAYGSFDAFDEVPAHPRWNPTADLNNDDLVDLRDIGIICADYGKTI